MVLRQFLCASKPNERTFEACSFAQTQADRYVENSFNQPNRASKFMPLDMGRLGPFLIEKCIGSGSSGTVYHGKHPQTGQEVAIKAVDLRNLSSEGRQQLEIEINVLRELTNAALSGNSEASSPYIVRLYDVIREADFVYLIEEFCPFGDLFDFISSCELDEATCKVLFRQITEGVADLHRVGIVHHDLKLENILLAPRAAESEDLCVKIIDFNYCCRVVDGGLLDKFRGTESYLAPEILEGFPYDGKLVDIWCLGVMLFIICFRRFPFDPDDVDKSYDQATSRIYLSNLLTRLKTPPPLRDLLTRILEPNAFKRISIRDILQHNWLRDPATTNDPSSMDVKARDA